MDRKVAERIIPMLVRAAQELSDTIEVLKSAGSDEQVRFYSESVGKAVFAIDDLLRPIVNEHPDLHP